MAFEDYDEFEQGEQVRKWIRENGIAVVAGVVLALLGIFGYRQWQAHRNNHQVQAAQQFSVLEQAAQADKKQAMSAALSDLQKNYADTSYAAFGSAAAAEANVHDNDLDAAAKNLEWAVSHSDDEALKALFMVRLARVQVAQDKADDALATLGKVPSGAYSSIAEELRGDAQLKLGKPAEARKSYQQAMAGMDKDAPQYNALQMKLDNLTQPAAAPTGTKDQ